MPEAGEQDPDLAGLRANVSRLCETRCVLIGRLGEASELRGLLTRPRGIAVVTGAAGVGKTALVRDAVGETAMWVQGLATAQERAGAALLPVLSSVFGAPERDASGLLRHMGAMRLVLDDAQWLDPYTRSVVDLVATRSRPVATWRTGDPSAPASPPRHWDPLALGPLLAADARALAQRSRPTLTASELEQILDVADGSPLLIEELAAESVPSPTVTSALLARVGRLSAAGRAAVVLVAAAEGGLDELLVDESTHDELRHSGLAVLVHGRWWPRHALLQESILEVVGPSMVRDAHAALADVLAPTDPSGAARHAARAGHREDAVALAERAVGAAEGPGDSARAILALCDLLEIDHPDVAWPSRVAATSALRKLGAFHEVLGALEGQALPTTDAELYGMARVNLAAAHWGLGDHQRALDHAERGLDVVQGTGSESELFLRAGIAMYLTRIRFDGPSALLHAGEALRIAHERGEHVPFARTRRAAALLATGDPGWRQESDGAVADAAATGDDEGEYLAREARQLQAFLTGDLDTALSDLRFLTDSSRSEQRVPSHHHLALRLLMELLVLGDRSAIVARAEQLLDAEATFTQRSVAVAAGAVAAIDLGRADIAHRLIFRDDPADQEELLVMAWARTELAWASGRQPSDLGSINRSTPNLAFHPAATMASVMAAWCCFEAGTDVPDLPGVMLSGFAAAVTEVQAVRALAQGDVTAAIGLFDEASAQWSTGSDRRGVLRGRWGAATAAGQGAAPDALERMERCWAEATCLQSAPIAARAAQALRRRGVHKPPLAVRAEPPLTESETQALRLLATGFTTGEVATLLGVQAGTVDDHVRHGQDRLGLRSRADALLWIAGSP